MQGTTHHPVPVEKQGTAECAQFSFSLAMRSLGLDISAQEIIDNIPVNRRPDGTLWGTSPAKIASYLLEGYPVQISALCSDLTVIDQSWKSLDAHEIIQRLEAMVSRIDELPVSNITRDNVELYAKDYIAFLKSGGNIQVGPITSAAIKKALHSGPVVAAVAAQHFYENLGRLVYRKDAIGVNDSITGRPGTHMVVISGYREKDFTVVDPEYASENKYSFEHIVTSIAAAQIESDNVVYCLSKK